MEDYCTLCNQSFSSHNDLSKHNDLLHNDNEVVNNDSYHCFLCGGNFQKKNGLLHHANASHKNEIEGQFKCTACCHIFFTVMDREDHGCTGKRGNRTKRG